jgi:predicted ATP-dependent serine protease
MTNQLDWKCTACTQRLRHWYKKCPYCKARGSVIEWPEAKEATQGPPPLGVHVTERIGVKDTVGGSKR